MTYEALQDKLDAHCWRVEAINFDGEGECYLAIFYGQMAAERAIGYANWMNLKIRAESAEATIREQAERIKELRQALREDRIRNHAREHDSFTFEECPYHWCVEYRRLNGEVQ